MPFLTFFLWLIRRIETVVNRRSRYLILHKPWSILLRCYSKLFEWLEFLELLDFPEWSIMDHSDYLDALQISETTSARRHQADTKRGEWQNTRQRPLHSMQPPVKDCNQEKDYILIGVCFEGRRRLSNFWCTFYNFWSLVSLFVSHSRAMGCASTDHGNGHIGITGVNNWLINWLIDNDLSNERDRI
jgi:hypothetical protein